MIGLAGHQTVEQTVLAREQLAVVRAAIAALTPAERCDLARAMALPGDSVRIAPGPRGRLRAALEAAGYPVRSGVGPRYPRQRDRTAYCAERNARPEVKAYKRAWRARRLGQEVSA